MSTADDELAADLARMRKRAERSAAAEVGTDCARLRIEVDDLRRTIATLREADERSRRIIADQAAEIGRLQGEFAKAKASRPWITQAAAALRSALELARAPPLEHEAAQALLSSAGGEWMRPGEPPDYAPRRFSDWFPLWDFCLDGKTRPSRAGKRLTEIYTALLVLDREAKEDPCR